MMLCRWYVSTTAPVISSGYDNVENLVLYIHFTKKQKLLPVRIPLASASGLTASSNCWLAFYFFLYQAQELSGFTRGVRRYFAEDISACAFDDRAYHIHRALCATVEVITSAGDECCIKIIIAAGKIYCSGNVIMALACPESEIMMFCIIRFTKLLPKIMRPFWFFMYAFIH